jgi:Uma2 family endonuclease
MADGASYRRKVEAAMSTEVAAPPLHQSSYAGLRLTAEEYFDLPDDGNKYELVEGVVLMSPSPSLPHQIVAGEILFQLMSHVRATGSGFVVHETDVGLGKGPLGGDLVYRPEIIYFAAGRVPAIAHRVRIVPDVAVEIISPGSRSLDTETKYQDYERAGVREYWLIDPYGRAMRFYRLEKGQFVEAAVKEDAFESQAAEGFKLNLTPIRAAFERFEGQ